MTFVRMLLPAALCSLLRAPFGAVLCLGALIEHIGPVSCFEGDCGLLDVTIAIAGAFLGGIVGVGLGSWAGWRSG